MRKLDYTIFRHTDYGGSGCLSPVARATSKKVFRNARHVVLIVRAQDLIQKGKRFSLKKKALKDRKLHVDAKLADGFPFRNEFSTYSLGSGFFIRKDVIATAAHVFFPPHDDIKFDQVRFVRGIMDDSDFQNIRASQIFKPQVDSLQDCQYHISQSSADWALIPIEPLYPKNRLPYKLIKLQTAPVRHGKAVYAIGHGLGLSMKWNISKSANILVNDTNRPFFECNLPAFVSSSGAPVFDAENHRLVGMLIRGTNPFSITNNQISLREYQHALEGEECQRIGPVLDALPKLGTKFFNKINLR